MTGIVLSIPQKSKLQTKLLEWFNKNARDLPWRRTQDPYAIWISEIMLQQTQVATVIPYYHRFLKRFPTVRRLAQAGLSNVLRVWEGLGYYSRARHLHRASQMVVDRFDGRIPDRVEDLLTLPGIGRYTAGAILSIAYNQEAPVLDGNVKRVLSRLFAISDDPREAGTEQRLWRISQSLIPKGQAKAFNQALMELGATFCIPKDPLCPTCPVGNLCKANRLGKPEKYPAKKPKKKIPHVGAVGAVVLNDGKVLLRQRPPGGLLGGLWEFPNWNTEDRKDSKRALKSLLQREMGITTQVNAEIGVFQQTYSHFKLTLRIYSCGALRSNGKGRWVPVRNLHLFPMSRVHRRIAQAL